jgi:DNA-binding response OmpR family regulator
MSKKVLIVEDDEQISRVYGIKFKQENIETISAADGEEGFKKISSEKPDLVLLDLMLPKKDGFWVLDEVRKKDDLKNIPIFVLSNLGQEQDKEKAIKLGARDYLVKADISIKEVVDKVKKTLSL